MRCSGREKITIVFSSSLRTSEARGDTRRPFWCSSPLLGAAPGPAHWPRTPWPGSRPPCPVTSPARHLAARPWRTSATTSSSSSPTGTAEVSDRIGNSEQEICMKTRLLRWNILIFFAACVSVCEEGVRVSPIGHAIVPSTNSGTDFWLSTIYNA